MNISGFEDISLPAAAPPPSSVVDDEGDQSAIEQTSQQSITSRLDERVERRLAASGLFYFRRGTTVRLDHLLAGLADDEATTTRGAVAAGGEETEAGERDVNAGEFVPPLPASDKTTVYQWGRGRLTPVRPAVKKRRAVLTKTAETAGKSTKKRSQPGKAGKKENKESKSALQLRTLFQDGLERYDPASLGTKVGTCAYCSGAIRLQQHRNQDICSGCFLLSDAGSKIVAAHSRLAKQACPLLLSMLTTLVLHRQAAVDVMFVTRPKTWREIDFLRLNNRKSRLSPAMAGLLLPVYAYVFVMPDRQGHPIKSAAERSGLLDDVALVLSGLLQWSAAHIRSRLLKYLATSAQESLPAALAELLEAVKAFAPRQVGSKATRRSDDHALVRRVANICTFLRATLCEGLTSVLPPKDVKKLLAQNVDVAFELPGEVGKLGHWVAMSEQQVEKACMGLNSNLSVDAPPASLTVDYSEDSATLAGGQLQELRHTSLLTPPDRPTSWMDGWLLSSFEPCLPQLLVEQWDACLVKLKAAAQTAKHK